MPGYRIQIRGTAHPHPLPGPAASPKRLEKVAHLLFATEPVCAQNPDSERSKVYSSHNKSRAN